ncbi:L,D-transpeptidase [Nakamurella antarctica]|uniref:L,D-transpeptidase n=1 Tax=Nakamurella antarctica TaxID=1902245 RepID=A0A3G8ZZ95_9ACTN|nr:Ig-like domain-containing protein [Nakamurella antarctica]AZI58871.1 L,D-transpeptidase [Nakamurella antarctica]
MKIKTTEFSQRFSLRRQRWWGISVMVTAGLVVSACTAPSDVIVTETATLAPAAARDESSTTTAPGTEAETAGTTPSVEPGLNIVSMPSFGSADLAPVTAVTITVFNASITALAVTSDTDQAALTGQISPDGSTWTLTERMSYATTYEVSGKATGRDGVEAPITGTYSTVAPADTQRASFQLIEGGVYGVAVPIIVTFAGTVADKAAAERTFKVVTDKDDIEGSWAWLQEEDIQGTGTFQSRAHFRPEEYWPGNTNVTVTADLYGVNLGGGAWGREDLARNFTIGRSQITIADVNTFRLVVNVDGVESKNYPVSYGRSTEDPELETRSGVHVVQEKFDVFEMCNPKYGYCGFKANWAVRISNNGEFIHENAAVTASLGIENVSHGCVNMSPADAKDFYDNALYGDPVEVSGTSTQLSPADGDIFDWTYSYQQWRTFSAL